MNTTDTVHVVDDDAAARRSTRWLLESEGFAVQTHSSAEDFLRRYDPANSGCLILDLRMPGMDGLEVQEELARRRHSPPVVFLTGYGDVPECVRAMKMGAVDFLEKPVDDETLLRVVRHALETKTQGRGREPISPELASRLESLTLREREVTEALYNGATLKQIAAKLGITFQTAAKHRARAMTKLGVDNEAELVHLLLGNRILPRELADSHLIGPRA